MQFGHHGICFKFQFTGLTEGAQTKQLFMSHCTALLLAILASLSRSEDSLPSFEPLDEFAVDLKFKHQLTAFDKSYSILQRDVDASVDYHHHHIPVKVIK